MTKLSTSSLLLLLSPVLLAAAAPPKKAIRVLVWSERTEPVAEIYPNGINGQSIRFLPPEKTKRRSP